MSCLKGPGETCSEDGLEIGETCAYGLRCCGVCTGCHGDKCAYVCPLGNSIAAKRASLVPSWLAEAYQRQVERHRLQQIQRAEQEQRALFPSPRESARLKTSLDRYPYLSFNNFEYTSTNDD